MTYIRITQIIRALHLVACPIVVFFCYFMDEGGREECS